MKRRFAIRSGSEANIAELCPQLQVIVNLAVSDQDRALGIVDWLIPGFQIDDGEAGANQTNPVINMAAVSIRTTVGQGGFQPVKDRRVWPAAVAPHHSRNSTHDKLARSLSKKRKASTVLLLLSQKYHS